MAIAFDITQNEVWPNEYYDISLRPWVVDPNISPYGAQNYFRYLQTPTNETTSLANFAYYNCTPSIGDGGLYNIKTKYSTFFEWSLSADRVNNDYGNTFNYFYIDATPFEGTTTLSGISLDNKIYYSYLLIPQRLVLLPISKPTYSGGYWNITTVASVTDPYFFFYTDNIIPTPRIANEIQNYLTTPLTATPFVNYSPNQTNITYNLSACRTRVEFPVVSFANNRNPFYAATVLENNIGGAHPIAIRPYSTFLSFNTFYHYFDGTNDNVINLAQFRPDTVVQTNQNFDPSYILVHYPTNSNTLTSSYQPQQTFQMVQIKNDNSSSYLSSPKYCVLSAVANLKTAVVKYFSNYHVNTDLTITNNTTGYPNSIIGFSYIADSELFGGLVAQPWYTSVKSTTFNFLGIPTDISPGTPGANTVTWSTQYPPHYYSYSANVIDTVSNAQETAYLTFSLSCSALSASRTASGAITSVNLYNYLASDHNIVSYDYSNPNMPYDYIKFNVITNSPDILNSITCYYGKNYNYRYNLAYPQWIPAESAVNIQIVYPILKHGELNFLLRPSLSSSVAGQFDSFTSTQLTLGQYTRPLNTGQPIFITKTQEYADYMEVDSSFLNSASAWPTRNLTNSIIVWNVSPSNSNVSLFSVDLSGNYIQSITPSTTALWGPNTWSVVVSGYGPQQTTITLSSLKYNEIASINSVPSLFNYFAENSIFITPSVVLDNYNHVRTITLQAQVPYKGRTYNLPDNMLLNWTWAYNGNGNYESIPISAFDVSSNYYSYGLNSVSNRISSLNFQIVPTYAFNSPKDNEVVIIASVDTPKGLLQGSCSFVVDDFPAPSIFNTDFYVYYTGYQSSGSQILGTRDEKYIITRPNLSYNNYTLVPYDDVIGSLYNADLQWSIVSTDSKILSSINNFSLQYTITSVSTDVVSLCALNAIVPGWTYPHNVSTSVKFNILNYKDFFAPLSFVTYPEYFWESGGKNLTLSAPSNYTLALAPTAYANKSSNSQTFYLSANKSYFTDYEYSFGTVNPFAISTNSYNSLLDIPYTSEFLSPSGLYISLSAFRDDLYPKYNGVTYVAPIGGTLTTLPFSIVANTVPFTNPLTASQTNFNRPPQIVPYNNVTFSYTALVTSMLLDTQTVVSVTQTFSTNPYNTPAIPVGGQVVYTLSNGYWTNTTTIPAVNGTYDIFVLNVGDAYLPLTVSGFANNTLTLTASANVLSQITSSTFVNYPSYTGNKNLWSPVNNYISQNPITIYANLTSISPQVYFSTVYALTGENIFVQYETPYLSPKRSIVAYITDFGENAPESVRVSAFDESLAYQYRNSGTYYVSYSAIFSDNSVSTYQSTTPLVISNQWETYDPNNLRKVEHANLVLPYTSEQISIEPNEFGDADIFNTSILRLQECIDYLGNNLMTLNTNSPTVYFGWLGSNELALAQGIKWHTSTFYSNYYLYPEFASPYGTSSFINLVDIKETTDYIFVLDGTKVRAFSADKVPIEIPLEGYDIFQQVIVNPTSIEVDEINSMLFLCDTAANKIYRFDMDLYQTVPDINPSLDVGGYGTIDDPTKFNSPSQIVYANEKLYVLDYNNFCVKEFNTDLNWTFTYYSDEFLSDRPESIAVHPIYGYLYILSTSGMVFVFEDSNNELISTFSINQGISISDVQKIIFDETGDFIYVITSSAIYKYSSDGYYVTTLNLPSTATFKGGKYSPNRSLVFFSDNYILKVQDVLQIYSVGSGLPTQYWSNDQLMVGRDEFAMDLNYNRSLIRLAQNLKSFRSSLNAQLVLATEQTTTNIITYFAIAPLSQNDLPVFDDNIELENIGVGVNELHVPQTLNKELIKFYDGIVLLKNLLDITNYNVNGGNCGSVFCWSWKGMSCYNLSLPTVRICSINPITYAELTANFPESYAPSKTWGSAISPCCSNVIPPV